MAVSFNVKHIPGEIQPDLLSVSHIHIDHPDFNKDDVICQKNKEYALVQRQVKYVDVEAVAYHMQTRGQGAWGVGHALRLAFNFIKAKFCKPNPITDAERKETAECQEEVNHCVTATDQLIEKLDALKKIENQDIACLQDNLPSREVMPHFLTMRTDAGTTIEIRDVQGARGSLSSHQAELQRNGHPKRYPKNCPVQRDPNPLLPNSQSSAGRGPHNCSPELGARIYAAIEAEIAESRQRNACPWTPDKQRALVAQIVAEQNEAARGQVSRRGIAPV